LLKKTAAIAGRKVESNALAGTVVLKTRGNASKAVSKTRIRRFQ
jgi:hypothetical protein